MRVLEAVLRASHGGLTQQVMRRGVLAMCLGGGYDKRLAGAVAIHQPVPRETMHPLLLTLLLSAPAAYLILTFAEHQIHRHFMHRKRFPAAVYKASPYLLEIFVAHGVRHHSQWYREFDFEPNPAGKWDNILIRMTETRWLALSFMPMGLAIGYFISWPAAFMMGAMGILHNRLWNVLHTQMHMPADTFFAQWRVFRFLARHHYLHHQFTGKNYNVVCPGADVVMGTLARPRLRDLREMMFLEYLTPRNALALARVQRVRANRMKARAQVMANPVTVQADVQNALPA